MEPRRITRPSAGGTPQYLSRADREIISRSNQELKSLGKFLVMEQVWGQARKSVCRSELGPAIARQTPGQAGKSVHKRSGSPGHIARQGHSYS